MFVYGISCPVTTIQYIAQNTRADYYMEYGILIFPEFTTASYIQNHNNTNMSENTIFQQLCKVVIENKMVATKVIREHPYLTESADDAVWKIREHNPTSDLSWYYVPRVAN